MQECCCISGRCLTRISLQKQYSMGKTSQRERNAHKYKKFVGSKREGIVVMDYFPLLLSHYWLGDRNNVSPSEI